MPDDHADRSVAFEKKHLADTIQKMASDLRRCADALDRHAKDDRLTDAWRVNNAWGEIRNMNSNLRIDVLISGLGRLIELESAGSDE